MGWLPANLRTNQSYKRSGRGQGYRNENCSAPSLLQLASPLSPSPSSSILLFAFFLLISCEEERGGGAWYRTQSQVQASRVPHFPVQTRRLVGRTGHGMLKWPARFDSSLFFFFFWLAGRRLVDEVEKSQLPEVALELQEAL